MERVASTRRFSHPFTVISPDKRFFARTYVYAYIYAVRGDAEGEEVEGRRERKMTGTVSSSVNSIYGNPLMQVSHLYLSSKRPSSPKEVFLFRFPGREEGRRRGGVFERVNQFRGRQIGLPQFYLPREADARQTLTDGERDAGDDKSRETVRRWQMEGCYGVVLEYVFTPRSPPTERKLPPARY